MTIVTQKMSWNFGFVVLVCVVYACYVSLCVNKCTEARGDTVCLPPLLSALSLETGSSVNMKLIGVAWFAAH